VELVEPGGKTQGAIKTNRLASFTMETKPLPSQAEPGKEGVKNQLGKVVWGDRLYPGEGTIMDDSS